MIAEDEVGLDNDAGWRWDGQYCHVTLALLAQAFLTVVRTPASVGNPEKEGPTPAAGPALAVPVPSANYSKPFRATSRAA